MQSQSVINDVQYYDIICIGNYAAICADYIYSSHRQKYKIAVLHLNKTVRVPSPSTSGTDTIPVHRKPRGADIIRKKIQTIMPIQKSLLLDDGHRLVYKYLIHGQDQWSQPLKNHPLRDALQNKYSRVYSNLNPGMEFLQNQGNIVFHIPDKPGSFRQNYPFLKIADQLRNSNSALIILLEGTKFFPHCPQAQLLLRQQLKQKNVTVHQEVALTKIDYLRRVLFFNTEGEPRQRPYESVYCFIGEQTHPLLVESNIGTADIHQKLLHSYVFDSLYVVGADFLSTTFSLEALGMQIHHIVQNVVERLVSQEEQRKAILTAYDGFTSFYLYLGNNQMAKISHKYQSKDYSIQSVGCCWTRFHASFEKWLIKQFLNFQNFGPPHYLWEPCFMGSQKWRDQGENYCEKEELIKLSQLNYRTRIG